MTTTTALKTFTFAPGLDLRSIDRDGSPWFVAGDICRALALAGYASARTNRLDADEKFVIEKNTQVSNASVPVGLFEGRSPRITLVSESGLYALVLGSKLPAAKEFKRWVTGTVLPSIRKHGGYMTPRGREAGRRVAYRLHGPRRPRWHWGPHRRRTALRLPRALGFIRGSHWWAEKGSREHQHRRWQ